MLEPTTPPVPDVIRRIANSADRHLAWEFFVFFARFDYALKRVQRYLKPGQGDAQPDWDKFARDFNDVFHPDANSALAAAVAYFHDRPPRKQLRNDGKMLWSDPIRQRQNESLLVWLLRAVRVVRNNLFHGGKFPLGVISDPSRDRELLTHAIAILAACVVLSAAVQSAFVEAIDA